MERPTFQFRQAQSAFDLIILLQSVDDNRLVQLGGEALVKAVRCSACRFQNQDEHGCYEAVAFAALDASEDAAISVAILVASALQEGLWSSDVEEFAEIAAQKIRSAPRKLRGAILRGLDVTRGLGFQHKWRDPILPDESRLTRPIEDILPKLCDLARKMDVLTRKSVAAADYGQGVTTHYEALSQTLASDDCQFPKSEFRYPREVVSLVSHVRDTPGFVCCTALLLANALPTKDRQGDFDFRLRNLAVDYNALPRSARLPILAGLRYLYEADEDFMSYTWDKFYDPVLTPEDLIKFIHLPDDID